MNFTHFYCKKNIYNLLKMPYELQGKTYLFFNQAQPKTCHSPKVEDGVEN